MRTSGTCVLLLLLAGLLVGVAEGHSVKGFHFITPTVQETQLEVKDQQKNSEESLEDSGVDDPDYVPDYDQLGNDYDYDDDYYDDDYYNYDDTDYSEGDEINSQEDEGSFIASEETEEGELWTSNEDPDWKPSGYVDDDTKEIIHSQEVDDSQEHYHNNIIVHNQPGVTVQEDTQPFPEVTSQNDEGSHGYDTDIGGNLVDDGSANSKKHTYDISSQVKGKRNVKRSYQAKQQVVVSPPYGSQQERGPWGSIEDGTGGHLGVSTGVEPVQPVGGPQPHDVATGVEPEWGGDFGDKGKESSGTSIGRWLQQGWRRFTGAVEDLGDKAEDTFRALGDKVEDVADTVHETVSGAADAIYQKLKHLVSGFTAVILKFGAVVQEGAIYCLTRFEHAADQVRESLVFEKLEQELKEGHAEVAKFFQILGEKVRAWRKEHSSGNVDAGLIDVTIPVSVQTQLEEGSYRQDFEEMPDFFQDDQVIVQLNKLEQEGVLTFDDVQILTQEHTSQNKPLFQQQQSQSTSIVFPH